MNRWYIGYAFNISRFTERNTRYSDFSANSKPTLVNELNSNCRADASICLPYVHDITNLNQFPTTHYSHLLFFQHIPPFRWGAQIANEHAKKSAELLRRQVEEHKTSRDAKEPRDYIDCFLQEIEERSMESCIMADQQGWLFHKYISVMVVTCRIRLTNPGIFNLELK